MVVILIVTAVVVSLLLAGIVIIKLFEDYLKAKDKEADKERNFQLTLKKMELEQAERLKKLQIEQSSKAMEIKRASEAETAAMFDLLANPSKLLEEVK